MGNGIQFTTEVGRGVTTFQALPEEILIDPELNGRHEHTDVEALAADIETNEQSTPVVCRKDEDGKPVLVFGHRRYRAFCLLNERNPDNPRKINFIYRKYNPLSGFVAAIGENRFRKDVSPIDDANNIEILQRKFGKTDDEIAGIYFPETKGGKMQADALKWVKDRQSLTELAPEAAQAVRDGRIKLTAAVALSKLTVTQQRKKVAKEGKIKGSDVKSDAPKKLKTPKPVEVETALKSRIDNVIESALWESYDEKASDFIFVKADALAALRNYFN